MTTAQFAIERAQTMASIRIDDLLDEMRAENTRLATELSVANDAIRVLLAFTQFDARLTCEQRRELKQTLQRLRPQLSVAAVAPPLADTASATTRGGRRRFACDTCSYASERSSALRVHVQTHAREKAFRCTFAGCEKRFKTKGVRDEHLSTHSADKRFKCDYPECVAAFRARKTLVRHKFSHTENEAPTHGCDWPGCDKKFPTKSQLKQHNDIHIGFKRYSCEWPGCEFRSVYIVEKQRHKRTHTGEKPYRCSWPSCESVFAEAHHLKSHLLKHTGERPFECQVVDCGRRFRSRQAMRFHVQRAHPQHCQQ